MLGYQFEWDTYNRAYIPWHTKEAIDGTLTLHCTLTEPLTGFLISLVIIEQVDDASVQFRQRS